LGRLEDVKRGWLFCEIAKKLPEYEFYVLGKANTSKEKNIAVFERYKNLPNLHFEGLVVGEEKKQFLKDAKILVNTSVHEALPVSFLEALSYGVCLVSNRNPDSLTEKFGVWTGDVLGDGFDKVDLYVEAIKKIMENEPLRQKMAEKTRDYVCQNHNVTKVIKILREFIMKESVK
jgi:glycosyltransferase involved in cell wall biosynthesis